MLREIRKHPKTKEKRRVFRAARKEDLHPPYHVGEFGPGTRAIAKLPALKTFEKNVN